MPTHDEILKSLEVVIDPELRRSIVELGMVRSIEQPEPGVVDVVVSLTTAGCPIRNHFETAVAQSLGMPAQMCTSAPICGKALAVEHDGRLYSCDHFVYPEYELGRIDEVHEGDLAFSRRQVEFGTAKHDRLPTYCRECPSLKLCWGECPKNRLLRTPDGDGGLNFLCEGLKAFYARVERDMPAIRQRVGR